MENLTTLESVSESHTATQTAVRRVLTRPREITYPESDGKPIADNTLQFRWIMTIQGGLDTLFADNPQVFVAGDLLWYPVEGNNRIRVAPDALIAFGRPKGYRGSYLQWKEAGIAPQVVFEILSEGNRPAEMRDKFAFYERHGVLEYYLYDPYKSTLDGWQRDSSRESLQPILPIHGAVSARLDIRFDLTGREMVVLNPDGTPFRTYVELAQDEEQARHDREIAFQDRNVAIQNRDVAIQDRDIALQRAEKMAERLRELGIDPDTIDH